tara:strand:- start:193 stop:372 length:180 start_codon:yes stop_codon:yes gene_type:complete
MISAPIFEASSLAETTIAFSVTKPVGSAGLLLQLVNTSKNRREKEGSRESGLFMVGGLF